MKKYEYKTIAFDGLTERASIDAFHKSLMEFGKEGWELIATAPIIIGGMTKSAVCFLKRDTD